MKKHSILTVIIILGIAIVVLGMAMTLILNYFGPSSGLAFSNKIGVVHVQGNIIESETTLKELMEFSKNKGIKAIILRIDSPGGGVGASQEIYREVLRTRESKKVIVSLGSVAASGGYYIAAAGDRIVANPGTITGSIGVILQFMQYKDLLKKIGVSQEVLKSGEFKDLGSPLRELTERDRELLEGLISDIQEQFIAAVAEGRNIPVEKVREFADGRIFSGATAKDLGLVDSLGNFLDAVDMAKKMSGIEGEANLVFPKKRKIRLLDYFFQSATKAFTEAVNDNVKDTSIEYRWKGLAY